MKSYKVLSWWPALLLLAGCGKPPEPSEPDAPRLDKVSVTCTPSSVTAGQSTQCAASAVDQNGEPFSVSSFTWTSGDEAIARVDATGKVATVAISNGNVAIRARADTTQGEASLAVAAKAPTVHATPVTASETWKAQDNPHLVSGAVSVDASATLTLEPGAFIRFAPDAELTVARGSLQAAGTAQAPVVLQAEKGGKGAWKGLVLADKNSASSLEFVTLSGCGGAQGAGACLVIRDGAAPVLKDVTVRESGSLGVLVATADSAFGAGSMRLSVSNSAGAAVRLPANQASTLPTGGSFTGNAPNVVDLTGTNVNRTQTWPNPGIPYLITEKLLVNDNAQVSVVTLTLSAGTQVRFGSGAKLVAAVSRAEDKPGTLVLDGTAEAPILLTAHSDTPQPGHWRGVHVRDDATNRFSHVIIEYAGQTPASGESSGTDQGNLNIYTYGSTPALGRFTFTNLTVRKGAGPGLSTYVPFAEGSARLTSRDNTTYPIELPPNGVGSLPAEVTFQDNGVNKVAISGGVVVLTQTWRNLGLPYLLLRDVYIGSKNNPTVTLAPGTEIRTAPTTAIVVGALSTEPGALVAKGTGDTADTSIRFIPDTASPQSGHWSGLHFWYAKDSRLDHVLVSHAGDKGDPNAQKFLFGTGNLNVYTNAPGGFVTNSRFENGKKCAVTRSYDVTAHLDATSFNNRFTNNYNDSECVND